MYVLRTGMIIMLILSASCGGRSPATVSQHNESPVPFNEQDAASDAGDRETATLPERDRELVRYLLRHNSQLQAQQHRAAVAGARTAAVDQLPDTMFKVMPIGDFAQTAAGEVQGSVGVEQAFPPPGVLGQRRVQAEQQWQAVDAATAAMQVQLVSQLRRQLLVRQRSETFSAIINKQQEVLSKIHSVVEAHIGVGSAQRSQLLEVEMMQVELDQALQQWQGERLDAEARLRALLNMRPTQTLPPVQLYKWHKRPQRAQAQTWMEQQHPALRQALAEQEAAVTGERLAGLSGRAGFAVGFQYTFVDDEGLAPMANGDDQWAVTLGLRIPLDRSAVRGRRESAAARAEQQRWQTQATRESLQQGFDSAWDKFESLHQRWVLSRDDLLPRSRERFTLLEAGYETGKSSYIDVMDAWRQVLKAEVQERQLFYMQLARQYELLSKVGLLFWPETSEENNDE